MKKLTTEEFIEKAKKIHGSKYDYSKTYYLGNKVKIKIICPKHGEFEQIAGNHISKNKSSGHFRCSQKYSRKQTQTVKSLYSWGLRGI